MPQIVPQETSAERIVKNNNLITFQLRLSVAFKEFLMSKRAETGKSMKSIVQESISQIYNFWPDDINKQ